MSAMMNFHGINDEDRTRRSAVCRNRATIGSVDYAAVYVMTWNDGSGAAVNKEIAIEFQRLNPQF